MIDWVHHESYTAGTVTDRTICGRCRVNNECAWQNYTDTICKDRPAFPKTNGDRIREMNDQELAKFIACDYYAPHCPYYSCQEDDSPGNGCEMCWLKWLKEAVP